MQKRTTPRDVSGRIAVNSQIFAMVQCNEMLPQYADAGFECQAALLSDMSEWRFAKFSCWAMATVEIGLTCLDSD